LFITILVVCIAVFFVACDVNKSIEEEKNDIKSISIQGPNEIVIGEFDFSSYTVELTKKDGTKEDIALSKDMISSEDLQKLSQAGEHEIAVIYNGLSTTFVVRVNKRVYDMSSIRFESKTFEYDGTAKSLTIQGNLPNGVSVEYVGNIQTEIGTYTVTAKFIGDGENYEPIADMVATMSIISPVYEINFYLNGGKSEKKFETINAEKVTKDDFAFDLTKEGWNFRGWSLNGVLIYDQNGTQLNEISYAKKMTFVAEFNQKAVLTIEKKLKVFRKSF